MKKIEALESLRGIAAVSVVLYHFRVGSRIDNSFVENAWLMVDFFFVLSGFVMTLAYSHRLGTRSEFEKFVKKRFLRIYPLHTLVLAMYVGLELLKLFLEIGFGFKAETSAFESPRDLASLGANLLLLQNFLPPGLSWNYPSWSISAEFAIYLLYAVVSVFLSRRVWAREWAFALLMLGGFATLEVVGMQDRMYLTGPSRCLFSFFLGHFAYRVARRMEGCSVPFLAPIGIGCSVLVVSYVDQVPAWVGPLIPILFAVTIVAIVFAPEQSSTRRVLELRPLVYLGVISYGIYMWHALVLQIVSILLKRVARFPVQEGADGHSVAVFREVWQADLVTCFVLVVVVALAGISHAYFEKRFYSSR